LPGAAEIAQGLVSSEIRWRNQSAASCPKDVAEIEAGRDLADLIANPAHEERGLEVVEDDALLGQFGAWTLNIRPSIALTSELTSITSELSDSKELLFAQSSSKYHCIEDHFYNARMLPRNIVVLQ
jgi:hypothetical protein